MATTERNSPCYVGRGPCGHILAAMVDDGTRPKDVAKFVASLVSDGLIVERMRSAQVRAETWCPRTCERRAGQRKATKTETLKQEAIPL